LSGTNLFLADSFAATPDFDNPTDVPQDFTGTQLMVPHPAGGTLYLKLRDDPETVQTLTLPVTLLSTAESKAAAAQAQPAAAPSAAPPATPATPDAPAATEPSNPPAAPDPNPAATPNAPSAKF
jgi:pyruvate/2-oxoglutarate dehydrogenase complex dihydrolipoamide acyltransferase (E2) component